MWLLKVCSEETSIESVDSVGKMYPGWGVGGGEVTFSLRAQMEQRAGKAELSLPLSPLEWMPSSPALDIRAPGPWAGSVLPCGGMSLYRNCIKRFT